MMWILMGCVLSCDYAWGGNLHLKSWAKMFKEAFLTKKNTSVFWSIMSSGLMQSCQISKLCCAFFLGIQKVASSPSFSRCAFFTFLQLSKLWLLKPKSDHVWNLFRFEPLFVQRWNMRQDFCDTFSNNDQIIFPQFQSESVKCQEKNYFKNSSFCSALGQKSKEKHLGKKLNSYAPGQKKIT